MEGSEFCTLTLTLTYPWPIPSGFCKPLAFTRHNVDEERAEFGRDVKVIEEEFVWGKVSSGGGIGWVVGARNVSCVKHPNVVFQKFQDASEDAVGWSAGAGFPPPPLDDPPVVSIDFDVITFTRD